MGEEATTRDAQSTGLPTLADSFRYLLITLQRRRRALVVQKRAMKGSFNGFGAFPQGDVTATYQDRSVNIVPLARISGAEYTASP